MADTDLHPIVGLYDADILEWSAQQSALLKRRAAGEPVDDSAIDWTNLAEEIEALGRSELRTVRSHLIQAMLHNLKCRAWPDSLAVSHWHAEWIGQRGDAVEAFSPSMRQHFEIADFEVLYLKALRRLPVTIDGALPQGPLPSSCPWTLDQLLAEDDT
jgi:hypothetical protein